MVTNEAFLQLVRLGVGVDKETILPDSIDWQKLYNIATQQGLSSVFIDGINRLPEKQRPPKAVLLQWIGHFLNEESQYNIQWKSACDLALLLKNKGIRTFVLKGNVVSECYPIPQHRRSVDLDCYVLPETGIDDVWEESNQIIEHAGFQVKREYYKNSTWLLPGLTVENHRWLTPFRGNKRLTELERLLQQLLREDSGSSVFEGTDLFRPPVMVSALFLIEHAYSHFLHEGLTWRHVLDWMLFRRKHQEDINWALLERWVNQFEFRKFYDSYLTLGKFLFGEIKEVDLSNKDKMMLADIWEPLDLHKTVNGFCGKLALVGNTWRARWKYHEFTDISWLQALWIQAKGFLFLKNPELITES